MSREDYLNNSPFIAWLRSQSREPLQMGLRELKHWFARWQATKR